MVVLQLPQWNVGWQCQVKTRLHVGEEKENLTVFRPKYSYSGNFFSSSKIVTAVPCTCLLASATASLRIAEEKGLLPSGKSSLQTGCRPHMSVMCCIRKLYFCGAMVLVNIAKYLHCEIFYVYGMLTCAVILRCHFCR